MDMVFIEYGVTAMSAAFNAWFFTTYRTRTGRRRIGAAVMALVSAALVVESLALGAVMYPRSGTDSWVWLVAGASALAGSVAISFLILRQRKKRS